MAHYFSERAETAATELPKNADTPPTDTFFIASGSKLLSRLWQGMKQKVGVCSSQMMNELLPNSGIAKPLASFFQVNWGTPDISTSLCFAEISFSLPS